MNPEVSTYISKLTSSIIKNSLDEKLPKYPLQVSSIMSSKKSSTPYYLETDSSDEEQTTRLSFNSVEIQTEISWQKLLKEKTKKIKELEQQVQKLTTKSKAPTPTKWTIFSKKSSLALPEGEPQVETCSDMIFSSKKTPLVIETLFDKVWGLENLTQSNKENFFPPLTASRKSTPMTENKKSLFSLGDEIKPENLESFFEETPLKVENLESNPFAANHRQESNFVTSRFQEDDKSTNENSVIKPKKKKRTSEESKSRSMHEHRFSPESLQESINTRESSIKVSPFPMPRLSISSYKPVLQSHKPQEPQNKKYTPRRHRKFITNPRKESIGQKLQFYSDQKKRAKTTSKNRNEGSRKEVKTADPNKQKLDKKPPLDNSNIIDEILFDTSDNGKEWPVLMNKIKKRPDLISKYLKSSSTPKQAKSIRLGSKKSSSVERGKLLKRGLFLKNKSSDPDWANSELEKSLATQKNYPIMTTSEIQSYLCKPIEQLPFEEFSTLFSKAVLSLEKVNSELFLPQCATPAFSAEALQEVLKKLSKTLSSRALTMSVLRVIHKRESILSRIQTANHLNKDSRIMQLYADANQELQQNLVFWRHSELPFESFIYKGEDYASKMRQDNSELVKRNPELKDFYLEI